MLESAGFADLAVRFVGSPLLIAGHKPAAPLLNESIQIDEQERVPAAVSA